MGWFNRRQKDRSDIQNGQDNFEDRFFTATGKQEGNPLVFRGRLRVADISQAEFPNLVIVRWPYQAENENGMPDQPTRAAQNDFDDIIDALDTGENAFLVLVATGNGRKVWHWYIADVDRWMNDLNALLSSSPVLPLEIEEHADPSWEFYHRFMSDVNDNPQESAL